MQYLLIPKLDTHWTGFQTNAALSIPSGRPFTERRSVLKIRKTTMVMSKTEKHQHCPAAYTSPAPTSLARQVAYDPGGPVQCQRRQAPGPWPPDGNMSD